MAKQQCAAQNWLREVIKGPKFSPFFTRIALSEGKRPMRQKAAKKKRGKR